MKERLDHNPPLSCVGDGFNQQNVSPFQIEKVPVSRVQLVVRVDPRLGLEDLACALLVHPPIFAALS